MTCSTCGLQDWKLIMGVQKIVDNALKNKVPETEDSTYRELKAASEKEKKEV